MNGPERHDDALRDVLRHTVDHIHASPDLAQRVESAAKRRRATLRGVTGTVVLAAVAGSGVLAAGHVGARRGASPASSTSQAALPVCAANLSAYQHSPATAHSTATHVATGPVVPGSPVAAAVCRYGEGGDLAASVTVTDAAQLGPLQAAMNESQAYTGPVYCLAAGLNAVVVFAYSQGADDLTVTYDGACASLFTDAGSFFVRGEVYALITAWTGNWRSEASSSTG
jgi:hypothetical protein